MKKLMAMTAIAAASFVASPAMASAKTLKLFSKPIPEVGGVFGPDGNPLTDNGQAPTVGSYFVGGDRLYRGTAKHHAKAVFGYDHLLCTIIDAQGNTRCNADLAVRNGAVYATNFNLNLQGNGVTITSGLFGSGHYVHVKSLVSRDVGNSDNSPSELTITY